MFYFRIINNQYWISYETVDFNFISEIPNGVRLNHPLNTNKGEILDDSGEFTDIRWDESYFHIGNDSSMISIRRNHEIDQSFFRAVYDWESS